MSKNHLATAAWLLVATLAFGLGWALKPAPKDPTLGGVTPSPQRGSRESLTGGLSALGSATKALELADEGGDESGSGAGLYDALMIGGVGSFRELSAIEIEDLGAQYRREHDPIKKRLAFTKLMAGMTLENALEIREQIAHLPPNDAAFRDFHYAFGQIAGAEAVLNGAETNKPDMLASLAGWASSDPAAAVKWFGGLDERNKSYANQEYLKMGMVHGLSDTDTGLATQFVLELAAKGDKRAGEMYHIVTNKVLQASGAAEAAVWASSLPAGDMRNTAMGRIAHDYARADPAAAAAWAEPMLHQEGGAHVVGPISHEWAKRDGPAAVGWIASLGESPQRTQAFRATFEGWVGSEPGAASQYLVEMPSSPDRDAAISGLVSRHRWEDPVSSIAWADQIADTGAREATLVQAGEAYFRRDPAGAAQWLPTSGLSVEVQQRIARRRR